MKNSNNILISPSIIASDLSEMGSIVTEFDSEIVDLLHMDVMDGNFVPNLTFGPGYIRNLQQHTEIPMDVHLMIEKPENSIESYTELRPWCVTIHYESTRFPGRILTLIRESGIKAGLALNPATPVEAVYDLLDCLDMVLVMSVDPGFYGQPFIMQSLSRIERLKNYLVKNGRDDILIQVDGGINTGNIASVASAGAKVIVAGSSSFKNGPVNSNVRELKKKALMQ